MAKALVAANLVVIAAGVAFGQTLFDKPDHFFREQAAGTYWSGAQILLAAWTASRAARACRDAPAGSPLAAGARLFTLVALGFAFLAVDEVARIHESLEDLIVRHRGPGAKPPLLDRIDDLIVLGYGLVGCAVLVRARAALRPFAPALPWIAAGFACFLAMVAIDLLTTRDDLMWALARGRPWVRPLWHWLPAVEEGFKLLGEAFFVVTAWACWLRARAGAPTPVAISRTG